MALSVVIPQSYEEAMGSDEKDQWQIALQAEFDGLNETGTWALCDLPNGRKAIEGKWVFDIKRDNAGNIERYKGRFVAKGFRQIAGVDYFDTIAPVVRYESIRLLLTLVASLDLEVLQVDAVTAFLNGRLVEEVYLKQPQGFVIPGKEDQVYRLHRAIYGLKQAANTWFTMLTASLLKIGFIQLHSDPCVFVRNRNDTQTIMAVYVDDFIIISSTSDENEKVYRGLEGQFKIKRIGEMKRFVGFEVERDRPNRILYLSQRRFAMELVERFGLQTPNPSLRLWRSTGSQSTALHSTKPNTNRARAVSTIYRVLPGQISLFLLAFYNDTTLIQRQPIGRQSIGPSAMSIQLSTLVFDSVANWIPFYWAIPIRVMATTRRLPVRQLDTRTPLATQVSFLGRQNVNNPWLCRPPKPNTWPPPPQPKRPFGSPVSFSNS